MNKLYVEVQVGKQVTRVFYGQEKLPTTTCPAMLPAEQQGGCPSPGILSGQQDSGSSPYR